MALDDPVAVVMIHGFLSQPKTWDPFAELISADQNLDFAHVLRFAYSSPLLRPHPLRRIPTYKDVALSLDGYLSDRAGDFKSVVLVSHSQGGLIIQRYLQWMLDEQRGHELQRIRQVVLFACPNTGAEIALSLRRSWLRRNPQQVSLQPFNEDVSAAHRTVINRIVHAREVSSGSCPIPVMAYTGEIDNVVPPAAARSSFPDVSVLPGDHFSIIQPDSPQHRTYLALRGKLIAVRAARPTDRNNTGSDTPRASGITSARRQVAAEAATPGALTGWRSYTNMMPEQLINVEDVIGEIASSMTSTAAPSALAVTGPGGLGKTAVTYAAVEQAIASGAFTAVIWASARNTDFSQIDATTNAISSIYWHNVLETIAAQLGLELLDKMIVEEELRTHINCLPPHHRLLLIVDNLELVHAADRVIERLRALGLSRPHKIVATSRWEATSSRSDLDVRNTRVKPLNEATTYDLVRLVAGNTSSDLAHARNEELRPIFDITQGNPFLVKLISRRYGETARSLPRIIDELTDAARRTGNDVRHWLYDQSLDELALRTSPEEASNLMLAFCTRGRGGSLTYDVLREENPGLDEEQFDHVLEHAHRLGLVQPSAKHTRYAIHSLLYEYIVPKQEGVAS
ncbi:alpha/beta fold hydrolase [Streptomyces sp. NBC_01239]|uniref:alpha/beta fold hydrolase n=1 Tax=Streptomyces sp. NBC_01239 TaxID=2903792 RepID=UPI002256CA4A|nr:alpha/beta fold hydrolase [Streptomyces sp. NBC_01239]MCX4810670.1 alpha/beta fold hydrolase [Streptomyces sp. NBC_01239]